MPKFYAIAILCSTKTVFTPNRYLFSEFSWNLPFETFNLKSEKNQKIKNYPVFFAALINPYQNERKHVKKEAFP
jgi:hypothetical protein